MTYWLLDIDSMEFTTEDQEIDPQEVLALLVHEAASHGVATPVRLELRHVNDGEGSIAAGAESPNLSGETIESVVLLGDHDLLVAFIESSGMWARVG